MKIQIHQEIEYEYILKYTPPNTVGGVPQTTDTLKDTYTNKRYIYK